jgi:hypothetical protein
VSTVTSEITLYDRPFLSVVQVSRDGVRSYLLRVREGASRSIVRAADSQREPLRATGHG